MSYYIKLIKELAVLKGDFLLSSGERTDTYIDMRQVALDPRGLKEMIYGIGSVRLKWGQPFDAIGGPTIGADPIVGGYMSTWYMSSNAPNGFLVRKEPKTHGTCRQIEGPSVANKRCLVIEDVTTTGNSAMNAVQAVEKEGGSVVGVIVMLDRSAGAAEKLFTEKGYRFTSLARLEDLEV